MGALGLSVTVASKFMKTANALAATPNRGGSVRVAMEIHGPDDQMDPIVGTSQIDYTRFRATYNGLTQILDNMALHPELAEEWSPNNNATEFTFKIRKGVTFHDGSKLTADDVVWSLQRHLGKESPSSIKSMLASVSEFKKVDSYTVKAVLSTPDAELPVMYTSSPGLAPRALA